MRPAHLLSRLLLTWWPWLLSALYGAVAWYLMKQYLILDKPVLLVGFAAAGMALSYNGQDKTSRRYAYAALLFSALCAVLPLKTLLYASLVCAVMFLVETTRGRTDALPVLVLLFLSPACQFMSDLFTFPLRLQLSSWAGKVLELGQENIRTEGNMIINGAQEFSVDPACMGMNMMITSLITGVVLVSIFKKRLGVSVRLWLTVAVLACITALNMLSNLIRIILLVRFSFLPGTLPHEVTGLLCFATYVMVPGTLLTRWAVARMGSSAGVPGTRKEPKGGKALAVFHVAVAAGLAGAACMIGFREKGDLRKGTPMLVAGYRTEAVDAQITKLQNDRSLVYLKKVSGFWAADHNPMICWRGSGYTFTHIREISLCHTPVYSAVLTKGTDELHTVWWYSNARHNTNRQLEWRWDMLQGAPAYSIVNITCLNEKEALAEAAQALIQQPFKTLLQ